MRYPTTTVVALVGVLGLVVAASLFLSNTEGAQRLGLVIGIATIIVNGLLNQAKTESAAQAATEAKDEVVKAVADGQPRSDAALIALTELLTRTEQKVDTLASHVTNGNGGEHTAHPATTGKYDGEAG